MGEDDAQNFMAGEIQTFSYKDDNKGWRTYSLCISKTIYIFIYAELYICRHHGPESSFTGINDFSHLDLPNKIRWCSCVWHYLINDYTFLELACKLSWTHMLQWNKELSKWKKICFNFNSIRIRVFNMAMGAEYRSIFKALYR